MTDRAERLACVLVVAGLDPSGGAGLAADLRALRVSQAWGCPVCAVLTVQSTAGLVSTHPVSSALVVAQADEVLAHQPVRAIKVGALGSVDNVRAVATILSRMHASVPSVVDPVMIATASNAGARLLDASAIEAMRDMVSVATVVTPNANEAATLAGVRVESARDAESAAQQLLRLGAHAVLVKGGHLQGDTACDVLALRSGTVRIEAPRLSTPSFHGGGCTLASLIAGNLAQAHFPFDDQTVLDAVRRAKKRLYEGIVDATKVGDGLLVLPL